MSNVLSKKLFSHGGSKAVDLPANFVKRHVGDRIVLEILEDGIFIPHDDYATMEADPLFEQFIEVIFQDAMRNPSKLKDLHEIWDEEWDELLAGVDVDEE